MNKNISPKLLFYARRFLGLTRQQIADNYPSLTVYQLRKIENNLGMDLYADSHIKKNCLKDLENFIYDAGLRYVNYGEFTGVYFSNTSKELNGIEEQIEDLKVVQTQDQILKKDIARKEELAKAKKQILEMKKKFAKITQELEQLEA
jgi:hypothetical protein